MLAVQFFKRHLSDLPLLGIVACALALVGCSNGNRPASSPHLVVAPDSLHLGTACPGEELKGTFTLRNDGHADLHLDNLEAGCACAGLRLSRDTLPPGEQAKLTVTVRIRKENDVLTLPVRIFSNDPTAPVTTCTVHAAAGPPVLRTDPVQLDFGEVAVGTAPAQRLRLLTPDATPWPVADAVSATAAGRSVSVECQRLPGKTAETLALVVRPRADLPLGDFADTLTLQPAASQRSLRIAVRGRVVPLLVVSPTLLYFGDVDPRTTTALVRTAVVRRTDGKPLGRLVKHTAPAGLHVEDLASPDAKPTATQRLRLTLQPRGLSQDVKDGVVSLWLEGEPKPIMVRVLVLLQKAPRSRP